MGGQGVEMNVEKQNDNFFGWGFWGFLSFRVGVGLLFDFGVGMGGLNFSLPIGKIIHLVPTVKAVLFNPWGLDGMAAVRQPQG